MPMRSLSLLDFPFLVKYSWVRLAPLGQSVALLGNTRLGKKLPYYTKAKITEAKSFIVLAMKCTWKKVTAAIKEFLRTKKHK